MTIRRTVLTGIVTAIIAVTGAARADEAKMQQERRSDPATVPARPEISSP